MDTNPFLNGNHGCSCCGGSALTLSLLNDTGYLALDRSRGLPERVQVCNAKDRDRIRKAHLR